MHEIHIPFPYLWLTAGMENRDQRFRQYVRGYLNKSYPDMELVKIEGMTAICRKR